MKTANLIGMLILVCIIPFLIIWFNSNNKKAQESQSRIGEIEPGLYQVTWYKQAGGLMRSKNLTAEQMIKQVTSTFNRAQDIMNFEVFSDGYKFSRANWRHARNAEGQKFGYVIAKRID